VFDELGRTGEEAVMIHYRVFSRHSLKLAKENYDKQVSSASFQMNAPTFHTRIFS
jgi:hypothetical protein